MTTAPLLPIQSLQAEQWPGTHTQFRSTPEFGSAFPRLARDQRSCHPVCLGISSRFELPRTHAADAVIPDDVSRHCRKRSDVRGRVGRSAELRDFCFGFALFRRALKGRPPPPFPPPLLSPQVAFRLRLQAFPRAGSHQQHRIFRVYTLEAAPVVVVHPPRLVVVAPLRRPFRFQRPLVLKVGSSSLQQQCKLIVYCTPSTPLTLR